MSCGTCGITENLSICAGCNKQTYCSKKCQKKDWKKHKVGCNLSECPICYEKIEKVNSMTTECGHLFHTSCMMKHASVNGFSCPCCRDVMVKVPEPIEPSEANAGIEWNEADFGPTTEEINMVVYGSPTTPDYKPTTWDIEQKLIQKGLTMRHFIQAFLKDHYLYSNEEALFMQMDDELYENIEEIINDMRRYPPAT